MNQHKTRWGQTVLEVCLTVIVTMLLLVAIASTWTYYTKNMTERMDEYKATRLVAADVLGSQTGRGLRHTPDRFNILGGYTIGDPVSFDDIEDYGIHCDLESYNRTLDLSMTLMNQSGYYAELSNNATSDNMKYKSQLVGLYTYKYVRGPGTDRWLKDSEYIIGRLLYGTDLERLFSDSWDQIEARLSDRVSWYIDRQNFGGGLSVCRNVAFGFFPREHLRLYCWDDCSTGPPYHPHRPRIAGDLRDKIFNPARTVERIIEPTSLKSNIMSELEKIASQLAKGYITPCAWFASSGIEDSCEPGCAPLLIDLEDRILATANCVQSAADNNLPQVQNCRDNPNFLPSARNALNAYEGCYQDNCGRSPWAPWEGSHMDICYDACRHFHDQAQNYSSLAEDALNRGQIDRYNEFAALGGLAMERFRECMIAEGCGEPR